MENLDRRQFVIKSSMTVGGLLGASAIAMGVMPPKPAFADDIKFVESSCQSGKKRILVAYHSYCGSTSEVAQSMADVFCKQSANVDVRHITSVKTVSSYDGVVIGSAVKSSSWYPNTIKFVKDNQAQLKKIPVVYFLTCLALYSDTDESKKTAQSYFNPVLRAVPEVNPKTMQAFGGVLDYSKLNMAFKIIMKSKMKKKGIPEGDYRDFKKIESWAKNTAWPLLTTA